MNGTMNGTINIKLTNRPSENTSRSTRWKIEDTDVILDKTTGKLCAEENGYCEESCDWDTIETLNHNETLFFLEGEDIEALPINIATGEYYDVNEDIYVPGH